MEKPDFDKTVKGLECCIKRISSCQCVFGCPYEDVCWADGEELYLSLLKDALELVKAQNEVITELLKVGYPHDFQQEKPWIVNYLYAITNVIKKAVRLNNG